MYSVKFIGSIFPQGFFKRVIYLGLRNKTPTSLDKINNNIDCYKTIEDEIIHPSDQPHKTIISPLPILLVWENSQLERFYAEII